MSPGKLFCRLSNGTNGKVVYEFFASMARAHDLRGATIILDNHSAHYNKGVLELMEQVGAELLFLPPASSTLNCIEVLWGLLKMRYRKALLATDPAVQGQRWMEDTL